MPSDFLHDASLHHRRDEPTPGTSARRGQFKRSRSALLSSRTPDQGARFLSWFKKDKRGPARHEETILTAEIDSLKQAVWTELWRALHTPAKMERKRAVAAVLDGPNRGWSIRGSVGHDRER